MGGTRSTHAAEEEQVQHFNRTRPPGRRNHRWEDNIKIDLKDIRYKRVDGTQLAQDRVQCRVLLLPVLKVRALPSDS
jgi:hypothetical protein